MRSVSARVAALTWARRASVIRAQGGSAFLRGRDSWVTVEERGSGRRAAGTSRFRSARRCSGVVMTPWRRGDVAARPLDGRLGAPLGGLRPREAAERASCTRAFGGRRPARRRSDPLVSRPSPECQGAEARDDRQRRARWPRGAGEMAGAVAPHAAQGVERPSRLRQIRGAWAPSTGRLSRGRACTDSRSPSQEVSLVFEA